MPIIINLLELLLSKFILLRHLAELFLGDIVVVFVDISLLSQDDILLCDKLVLISQFLQLICLRICKLLCMGKFNLQTVL